MLCSPVLFILLVSATSLIAILNVGGEDGYVRLHHFDIDYHATRFF